MITGGDVTVWKYELEVVGRQSIQMPIGAKILTVQVQYGRPQLWALVDPVARRVRTEFISLGTGHPINPSELGEFAGTYQIQDGALVFHVFRGAE